MFHLLSDFVDVISNLKLLILICLYIYILCEPRVEEYGSVEWKIECTMRVKEQICKKSGVKTGFCHFCTQIPSHTYLTLFHNYLEESVRMRTLF